MRYFCMASLFASTNPRHAEEPTVSPLGPDSPTLGYLSPVSILGPDPRLDKHGVDEWGFRAPRAGAEVAVKEEHPARDNAPHKQATSRNPLATPRPTTLYLADHAPHLVAPVPTARPHYPNGVGGHEGRSEAGFEDVELRGGRNARDGGDDVEGQGRMRTIAGVAGKGRRRNCLIGWVFVLALVVAGVVFGVLVRGANRPGGVAG